MAKSPKRRVRDGKRIDRWTIREDGRDVEVDVYMVRPFDRKAYFRAICEEVDLDLENEDLNALEKDARKEAKARVHVKWERYLHLKASGYRPKGDRRDEDLFVGSEWSSINARGAFGFKLEVELYELAEIGGERKSRHVQSDGKPAAQVHNYWPTVGREEDRYYGEPRSMQALVPDTPENRAALLALRKGVTDLVERLDALFAPDAVAETLRGILAGGGPLALPSGVEEWTPENTVEAANVRRRTRKA